MVRLSKHKENGSCIFCGKHYQSCKVMKSELTQLDYIFIKPLYKKFYPVCKLCEMTVLKDAMNKHPHLF